MKRNPVKTLKRKTWQALSRYIRNRDPKCVTCGGSNDHCGHYIRNTERNQLLGGNELWYDERNFGSQCVRCNTYGGGEQARFTIYLEKKYGYGIVQELHKLWLTPKKWTKEEIQSIYDTLSKAQN